MSRGLGAGGSPNVGERAAEESREEIMTMVKDADLVFVTAGPPLCPPVLLSLHLLATLPF